METRQLYNSTRLSILCGTSPGQRDQVLVFTGMPCSTIIYKACFSPVCTHCYTTQEHTNAHKKKWQKEA
jgi:hypothetical protein